MLSLYIHIPFCVRKCHYCGFYSTLYSRHLADEFISALRLEAEAHSSLFADRVFDTVYIGGGTPTVLVSEHLENIIAIAREHFQISCNAEWTIEANPNSMTFQKLIQLQELGVNRLSIGIQSFSDDILKFLGRMHTAQEALDSYTLARNADFNNIGIDLIYGVPGQTELQWSDTVEKAVSLKPEHISAYCLSVDEGSRFMSEAAAGRLWLPDDDFSSFQYEYAFRRLIAAGYERYEISNFARPGYSCRHNINYWTRGEYLGLGPGASSFVFGKRYRTSEDVSEYVRQIKAGQSIIDEEEIPDPGQAANETIMLGLRTSEGVDLARYEKEFGIDAFHKLSKNAVFLKQAGLLEETTSRLKLTERGFLVANEAVRRLVS